MARKSNKKYDIVLEIDYYGDELNLVIKKGGHVDIYPMDEAQHILDRLEPYQDEGVIIKDHTKKTVYSQKDEYTQEEYDNLRRGDMWGFRWF